MSYLQISEIREGYRCSRIYFLLIQLYMILFMHNSENLSITTYVFYFEFTQNFNHFYIQSSHLILGLAYITLQSSRQTIFMLQRQETNEASLLAEKYCFVK